MPTILLILTVIFSSIILYFTIKNGKKKQLSLLEVVYDCLMNLIFTLLAVAAIYGATAIVHYKLS